MDVLKSDCGGITGAGEYRYRDGHLIVTLHQIAIWAEHPEAIFTAAPSVLSNSIRLYVLATWRLPKNAANNQPPASANAAGMSRR